MSRKRSKRVVNVDTTPQPIAARQQVGRPLSARSRASDFSTWLGITNVTPERARYIVIGAMAGDIFSQWELFNLMEDSWCRLAKNLAAVKNAVKRITYNVVPASEANEPVSDQAAERAAVVKLCMGKWLPEPGTMERGFEDFIYDAMDALGKGLSVSEILWTQRSTRHGTLWLPRASQLLTPNQYGWNDDQTRLGLRSVAGWEAFPDDQVVVGQWLARSGPAGMTALLRPLVPYWVGRTYGWQWLLQNAQIFGVPFRWGTYDPSQPGIEAKLADMLENLGAVGWAAFPAGTSLEFKEALSNATGNPQVLIMDLADKAADILILGQTLTTDAADRGTQALGRVHEDVKAEVITGAVWWVADLLSYQLSRSVVRINFGDDADLPTIVPDTTTQPDPKALAERDEILSRIGMKIPVRFMYERHQVPEPMEGEPVIEKPAPPALPLPGTPQRQADPNGAEPVHAKESARSQKRLAAAVLETVTPVAAEWLAGARPWVERLIAAAQDSRMSDAEFLALVQAAAKNVPEELAPLLKPEAIASALEKAMGAACVNGAVMGYLTRS